MSNPNEMIHEKCPICENLISLLFGKSNRYGTFSIHRCSTCRFAFVNPTPSQAYIEDFYHKMGGHVENTRKSLAEVLQQEKIYPNAVIDADRIALQLRHLAPNGRVLLDVGCGYGLFSRAAINAGFSVAALEISPDESNIAADLIGTKPENVTFEAFDSNTQYDAMILSQVLEHAREPVK